MLRFYSKYNRTVLSLGVIFTVLLTGVLALKLARTPADWRLFTAAGFILAVDAAVLFLFFKTTLEIALTKEAFCFRLWPIHKNHRCIAWQQIQAVHLTIAGKGPVEGLEARQKLKSISYRLGGRHTVEIITRTESIYTLGVSQKDGEGIARYAARFVKVV